MSNKLIRFSAVTMIVCTVFGNVPAFADDSCNGTWIGHYLDRARGWDTEAELTVLGDKGKWVARLGKHKQQNSPCRDQTFPVDVLKCTDTEFNFQIDGSSIMSPRGDSCPSHNARLVRKDADTAEGVMGVEGMALKVIRKQAAKR
jgi:hypothetical protein